MSDRERPAAKNLQPWQRLVWERLFMTDDQGRIVARKVIMVIPRRRT